MENRNVETVQVVYVDCDWEWSSRELAARALMSTELASAAIDAAGEHAVQKALAPALDALRLSEERFRYANRFRDVIAATERHGPEAA